MPAISVILPFYNAADTLAEAVASIQRQSCPDFELILLDDGSTDASPRIAQRLAAADPRLHLITQPHAGIVAALQRACAAAQNPWLARMDADDIAAPQRLERQHALMRADPHIALCGTRVAVTGPNAGPGRHRYERWINALITPEDHLRELFVECPIAHPTFFMRRDAFQAVGGYQDHGGPEDYDLCLRLALAGHRLAKCPETLLEWRDLPGRLSMTSPRYSPEAFRALKRRHLRQTRLAQHPRFIQWGAGEVGKRWLREWDAPGPQAVVDINPRKIGRTIHGVPVIAPQDLPPPGRALILIAVGAPGARQTIRDWLAPRGYQEPQHYLFIA